LEIRAAEDATERVELLLLELARAHQWTGMYPPGHPFLRERVTVLHQALCEQAAAEPEGVLLLGVARDKVMYRDHFLPTRHPLVISFAEELYRHHVATFGFSPEAAPEDLLAFFRCLRELIAGEIEELPSGYLERKGLRGITLSPVNYRQLLSRGIVGRAPLAAGESRAEVLWKDLTRDGSDPGSSGWRAVTELAEFPEILPAILRRARSVASSDGADAGGSPPERVSGEVLRRMLQHLGQMLKALPAERQRRILEHLEDGLDDDGGPVAAREASSPGGPDAIARSLLDGYSNADFLELMAAMLSLKGKGGRRLLESFGAIAAERDVRGALLPLLASWSAEGRHAKEYYDVKTWQAVERLLLERSEEAYLGSDHEKFLEGLSADPPGPDTVVRPAPGLEGELAPFLEPKTIRRKGVAVLLDLLVQERQDTAFEELLAEARETVPWLMEEREFALLRRTLDAIEAAGTTGPVSRREMATRCLASVDFGRFAEVCLSGLSDAPERRDGFAILVKYGALAADPLLDRLLAEPEKDVRKVLLAQLVRIGEPAVPAITARFRDLPWYFLRNLCFILGEIGGPGTVPPLVRMVSHKERRVRREAVQALGKLRATDPDAVIALGRVLLADSLLGSPKDDAVRVDAANALYRIGGADALSFLHRGKTARRGMVRDHCDRLLRARVSA
jgi:hypothetical protein